MGGVFWQSSFKDSILAVLIYIILMFLNVFNSLHKKKKFSITYCFSKCDQIRRKLRTWSHLLKNSLMENFILCAVTIAMLWLVEQYLASSFLWKKLFLQTVADVGIFEFCNALIAKLFFDLLSRSGLCYFQRRLSHEMKSYTN